MKLLLKLAQASTVTPPSLNLAMNCYLCTTQPTWTWKYNTWHHVANEHEDTVRLKINVKAVSFENRVVYPEEQEDVEEWIIRISLR